MHSTTSKSLTLSENSCSASRQRSHSRECIWTCLFELKSWNIAKENLVRKYFNIRYSLSTISVKFHFTENVRQELAKANPELISCIADVIVDNEKCIKMVNDENERLKTDFKLLEGRYECNITKLSEVEGKCKRFEREVEDWREKYGKQELKIRRLQREIDALNADKKRICDKFTLLKCQEKVHDVVVGALKRQFEEEMADFLNAGACSSGQSINVEVPIVESASYKNNNDVFVDLQDEQSPLTGVGAEVEQERKFNMELANTETVYPEESNTEDVNMNESEEVEHQSTRSVAGNNLLMNGFSSDVMKFLLKMEAIVVPRSHFHKPERRYVSRRNLSKLSSNQSEVHFE